MISALPTPVADEARRIAKRYLLPVGHVVGRVRHRRAVQARHELWTVTLDTLDLSYPDAGRMFGVDHTTIIHGVRRHRERRQ